MDKAIHTVSELTRNFIEDELGFGEHVEGPTLSLLFTEQPNVFHYCKVEGTVASINAMDKSQWDGMHFTETGAVLRDAFTNAQGRVVSFLEKELAKSGYAAAGILSTRQSESLRSIKEAVKRYHAEYLGAVDPQANLESSITLRKSEGSLNWDMVIRVGLFAEFENSFVQFTFPGVIHKVSFLITEEQVKDTTKAVRDFFFSFAQPHYDVLSDLPSLPLSNMIVHQLIHNKDITPETMWSNYHTNVARNLQVVVGGERVMPWVEVTPAVREILQAGMEIARHWLATHIAINTALATN